MISYDTARWLKGWIIDFGFAVTSAEITALVNIENFGSLEPVLMKLDSVQSSEANLDCNVYSLDGQIVGQLVFSDWLKGEKNCGDIKHFLALHLTQAFGSSLAATHAKDDFEWEMAKGSSLVDILAIGVQDENEIDTAAWSKYAATVAEAQSQFATLEQELLESNGLPDIGGRFVDLKTLQTVAVVSSFSGDSFSTNVAVDRNSRAALFSREGAMQIENGGWLGPWIDGKWAYVPHDGGAIASEFADKFAVATVEMSSSREAPASRFLSYSYLEFKDLFPK